MISTLPVFVGLDYSQHAVQVCVLDPNGKVLCNRAVADDAGAIAQVAHSVKVSPLSSRRSNTPPAARFRTRRKTQPAIFQFLP